MTVSMRVGELARRSGLTVRTLHHWEAVGLLTPTGRTPAGHRLYGPEALRRVLAIQSLKGVGMGLEAVGEVLAESSRGLEDALRTHREHLRARIRSLRHLEDRLERVLSLLGEGSRVPPEELLETLEMMTMFEKHYTPEQLEALAARREALGPQAIQEVQAEWPRLIARVREEMEKETDPASPQVQILARQWKKLIHAFTGGDSGMEASLRGMYTSEPEMARQHGLDPGLFDYLNRAWEEED